MIYTILLDILRWKLVNLKTGLYYFIKESILVILFYNIEWKTIQVL